MKSIFLFLVISFYATQCTGQGCVKNEVNKAPNSFCEHAQMNDTVFLQNELLKGTLINQRYSYGKQAIHYAANSGALASVKFLIRNGAEYTKDDDLTCSVLELACRSGNLELVKFMHEELGLSLLSSSKNTPINFAANCGYFDLVKYIISEGADPLANVPGQNNVFYSAIYGGNVELVKFLHQTYGFSLDSFDIDLEYPIMGCYNWCNHPELTYYLLQNGANPNVFKHGKWDPIYNAAICVGINQDYSLIDSLLKYKANPYLRNFEGENTFDRLNSKEDADIIRYLEKAAEMYKKDAVKVNTMKQNGFVETDYNGFHIKGRGRMKDAEKSGFWQYYFKNGLLESEGSYLNGQQHGLWKFYFYPDIEATQKISKKKEVKKFMNVIKYMNGAQDRIIRMEW